MKMMKNLKKINLLLIILPGLLYTCKEVPVPKPRGYFRIDFPQKSYVAFNDTLLSKGTIPLTFDYPSYGRITLNNDNLAEPGWFNIDFPRYKAKIHLTYKKIQNNLDNLLEQTYRLNIKNHITKADAINEELISNPENKVYGMLYDLKGNTATAVQFFVTDSTRHFLRGSLYFSAVPDADSLAPVIDFFREDIIRIIETLKWKY